MKYNKLVIFLIFYAVSIKAITQDFSSFTQFYMNPYAVNPSYAGTDGKSALFLTYRKQWTGIEGAPTIMNMSYHMTSKTKLNFGINVNSDKRGVLETNSLLMTIGYTLPVSKEQYIRFGVSAGASMNSLDIDLLQDEITLEPQLLNILDQNIFLLGNVGLSYHNKYFNLGVSIPQIFESAYTTIDEFTIGELAPFDKAIIYASHRFYFGSDKYAFEPHVLYRHQKSVSGQIEAAGILHINHVVWVGGSYKQDFGIAALGGVKVNNLFALGYSYGLKSTGANEINSPTHEVQLNYLFGKNKDKKHVYSFVATKKPKKKKDKRKEALEKKKEEERLAKEAALKKEQEEQAAAAEAKRKEEERKAREDAEAEAQEVEPEVIEEPEVVEEPETVEEQPIKTDVNATEEAVKDELQKDHYVIVGSFANKEDAERNKKQLLEQGITVHHGYSSHLKEYYVYTMKSGSAEEARAERDRIRNSGQFKDAWHLEVAQGDITEITGQEDGFTTDKPVVVKKGDHFLELNTSEYVVVGAFSKFENAEKYSDQLFEKGFKAKFGFVSQKNTWYVHLFETKDSLESRLERDKYRKMSLFKNAWVLTIVD